MRAFLIALGIGFTVYLFTEHAPMWLCIVNVVLDALLVLQFITSKR